MAEYNMNFLVPLTEPKFSLIKFPSFLVKVLMLVLYSITMGLSALLLFSVQPMISKMILPLLGDSPVVWDISLVLLPIPGYGLTFKLTLATKTNTTIVLVG